MSDGERYVGIKGKIASVRAQAILFTVGDSVPRGDWIPRSLIFGPDELKLDRLAAEVARLKPSGGLACTLRIFRWKAEECGFLSARDDQTEDLFSSGRPIPAAERPVTEGQNHVDRQQD